MSARTIAPVIPEPFPLAAYSFSVQFVLQNPAVRRATRMTKEALGAAERHNLALVAAGVAFFCLLALFPTLFALVSIYGLVRDPSDISDQIDAFAGVAPPSILSLAREQLERLLKAPAQGLALQGLISLVIALWSSQQGVRSFLHALNIVYDDAHRRKMLPRYGMGAAFTLAAIAFAGVAVATFTIAPLILDRLGAQSEAALFVLRWPAMIAAVTLFALALYRWGPNRAPPPLKLILPGALIASGAWLVASAAFSAYAQTFGNYGQAYGSIASVVVLLLWLFVTAFVFLVGAEFNAAAERRARVSATPTALVPEGSHPHGA